MDKITIKVVKSAGNLSKKGLTLVYINGKLKLGPSSLPSSALKAPVPIVGKAEAPPGKAVPVGEARIPQSPQAVKGTTVTLMQEQRLANGQVIPKGSKVTWSDNAVKVVRPDGSKRVFSSRILEQNKKTDVPRIEKADVLLIEKLSKTHGVADKVSMQKQKRHILGTAPHDKSYLSSYKDAQAVLDAYKSGTARVISIDLSDNSVLIEVKNVNGVYVNRGNPNGKPDIVKNTNIFKIQSINKSPKVVPVNPNKGK